MAMGPWESSALYVIAVNTLMRIARARIPAVIFTSSVLFRYGSLSFRATIFSRVASDLGRPTTYVGRYSGRTPVSLQSELVKYISKIVLCK